MKAIARVVLAILLIVRSIPAQQSATDAPMKQSIAALPAEAHVEVQLTDGTSLRGRVTSRAENGFALKLDRGPGTQTISYDQVRSLSQVKGKHSNAKWITIGVVVGAAVVVGIIVIVIATGKHGVTLRNG